MTPGGALSVLAAAGEAPARLALIADGASLTYGELSARVRRAMAHFAPALRDAPPGAPAAVVASLRVETVVALWALWELGRAVALVHPRSTPPERAGLLASCAPALVVEGDWSDAGLAGGDRSDAGLAGWGAPAPPSPASDEAPFAIVFTSGTSGRPKGVVLSRRAFAASARASEANLGWGPDDRWLLTMPLAHVGGLSVLTRCVLARRAAVLAPWAGSDAAALGEAIGRHGATLLSLVPTMLHRLFEAGAAWRPPKAVRAVLLGGAPAPGALLAEAAARGVPALTTYGMSETCAQVATQRPGTPPGEGQGVGPPLPGVEMRFEAGEILVRGPTMMSGYLGGGDPFRAGGWFPTGDLGALDEAGRLHVLGRRSDTIITGGENVSPREVERALEGLPGVAQACVFGVDDERWGQVVAAAIVPSPSAPLDEGALVARVAALLAPHKRPRRVAVLGALPANAAGKIDRRAVARAAAGLLRPFVAG